ncbi:MAG: matrixin family metalloprotease [Pseudomonadota bacterium]
MTAVLIGPKWGEIPLGTPGGVVTWSVAGAGTFVPLGIDATSVDGSGLFTFDFEAVLRDAFAQWSQAGNLEFIQVPDHGGAFDAAEDADIRIFFTPIPGSAVGFASSLSSGFNGDERFIFQDVDIVLDTDIGNDADKLLEVTLHEIGHGVGFEHNNLNSILFPFVQGRTALTQIDLDGAELLYGAQDGAVEVFEIEPSALEFEVLHVTGNVAIQGNDLANRIIGSDQGDRLRGAGGNDTLIGGEGADILTGGGGTDTASYEQATARVRADLQGGLSGIGEAAGDLFFTIENLLGSIRNDDLRGDTAENRVEGGNGFDKLHGRAGDDSLIGGSGGDVLYGNAGSDQMSGGFGNDRYIYFSENDSRVGTSRRDTITDFNRFADRIELGRLDADTSRGGNQSFDFIGTATFSGTAGELRFFQSAANGFTLLQADTDGDGVQEFQIELTGMITLTEDNFTL